MLKSKLGLYHVLITTPKTSPEKHKLYVVGMHKLDYAAGAVRAPSGKRPG